MTAYAALVALGSDLTAADLVRMAPGISADSGRQMMVRLEAGDQVRPTDAAVLAYLWAQPIVSLWSGDILSTPGPRRAGPVQNQLRRSGHIAVATNSSAWFWS